MQTFLPYPSFTESAACLDMQRLGKQRVEAWQIYRALTDHRYGWQNHPAVNMWRGYESALLQYGIVICLEWQSRSYNDTMLDRFVAAFGEYDSTLFPPWLGDVRFHLSHQSALVRKKPAHYRVFFPDVPTDLPYVWPTYELSKAS